MSTLGDLSPEAIEALSRDVIPVCYLVELDYGDSRYMSTNKTLTALSQTWQGASVNVDSSSNWETARITLDNSNGRYA